MPENRRQYRLAQEWASLQGLTRDSDHVHVRELDVLPGSAPERYAVTFQCRGIASVDAQRNPVYGTLHEVEIYCHAGFPADAPWLAWRTPMWHPNIEHDGARRVCINKAEWLGGMKLTDLCQQLLEMIQYKNYHADNTPPYPLDSQAAAWVREVGEPRGIVDKKRGIYTDNVLFYRPARMEPAKRIQILPKVEAPLKSGPRVKFQVSSATDSGDSRVVMEAGGGSIACPRCEASLPLDSVFCGACGAETRTTGRRVIFNN